MSGILSFLETVIRFLSSTIRSIVSFIVQLPGWYGAIIDTFAYMPDFVLPLVTISLSVTILIGIIRLI